MGKSGAAAGQEFRPEKCEIDFHTFKEEIDISHFFKKSSLAQRG
jgi:hypothetical protein